MVWGGFSRPPFVRSQGSGPLASHPSALPPLPEVVLLGILNEKTWAENMDPPFVEPPIGVVLQLATDHVSWTDLKGGRQWQKMKCVLACQPVRTESP